MPLTLPDTFAFSQSSLQAYEECPRRFWLAFAQQLPWPAIQAAPFDAHEEMMQLGSAFHQLVERAENGIDPALLGRNVGYPLDEWFADYLAHRPADLPTDHVEIERILSVPFGNYRLVAKYDLIAAGDPDGEDQRVVIVDWKTSKRRQEAHHLREKFQTLAYPYVLVEASAALPWGPVRPEQVELRYWFTAAPEQPVIFAYDSARHNAARVKLEGVLARILEGEREADFPKVVDTEANRRRLCHFCVYRSRCDRGITAGDVADLPETEMFAPDLAGALEFSLDELEPLAF